MLPSEPAVLRRLESAWKDKEVPRSALCERFGLNAFDCSVLAKLWGARERPVPVVTRRDTGQPAMLAITLTLDTYELRDIAKLRMLLRDLVRDFMRHEADEAILVAGIRVFDPHAKDPCVCGHPRESHDPRYLNCRQIQKGAVTAVTFLAQAQVPHVGQVDMCHCGGFLLLR